MRITKNIDYNEKEKSLKISGYRVEFVSGGLVEMVDLSDEDKSAQALFNGSSESISLSKFLKINLVRCSIVIKDAISIPHNGVLVFTHCLFDSFNIALGQYSHNLIRYKLNKKNPSILHFDGMTKINFQNVDIDIIINSNIKLSIKHMVNEIIYLEHNIGKIIDIKGSVRELNSREKDFIIKTSEECFVKKLINTERLIMKNISFKKGHLLHLNEKNELRVQGVGVSYFEIKDILLRLDIKNVDFNSTNIYFNGSAALDIENLKSMATVWNPSAITYRGFCAGRSMDKSVGVVNVLAAQEFFSEMKKYFSDKGNSVRASYFYTSEMEAHRAYLRKRYSWYPFHHERIIAGISKHSSNFSQNWFKAFSWYIFIGSLFAIIFYYLDKCNGSLLDNIDAWFKYLVVVYSPLTIKFREIEKYVQVAGWAGFLWIFWKVIAGYLIYQMITSSRKFVRF